MSKSQIDKILSFHENRILQACNISTYIGSILAKEIQQCFTEEKKKDDESWAKPDYSSVSTADFAVQALITYILIHYAQKENQIIKLLAEECYDSINEDIFCKIVDRLNTIIPISKLEELMDFKDSENTEWTKQLIFDQYNSTKIEQEQFNFSSDNNLFGNCYFVLDPIDGTSGFLRLQHFAVGLCAVEVTQRKLFASSVACVHLPNQKSLQRFLQEKKPKNIVSIQKHPGIQYFFSLAGEGTWNFGTNQSNIVYEFKKIEPSNLNSNAYVNTVESYTTKHRKQAAKLDDMFPGLIHYRLDSMAKFCLIARGDITFYLRGPSPHYLEKVWDILPPQLIIQEAGGYLHQLNGKLITGEMKVTIDNQTGMVATMHGQSNIHQQLLKEFN